MKNLADSYDIVDNSSAFLSDSECKRYQGCIDKFLFHYVALALGSAKSTARIGQYQWSFVPKFHYLLHIAEDAKYLSPRLFWCYGGESMVGVITSIAQSCLSGMPPWRVTWTVCMKYSVARHLYLAQMAG